MSVTQINITVGTAGHIDHGKTALVKSLTGCETDRLKEEKERGMSIDLGFAPCTIADTEVGIVDVPGHENFIRTMVAGAAGMDAVILVVAADDGVMPQTREHLDILTLLGIRHGMVALTKIDRVEPDHLALARAELEDFLRGTFLEGAPILPVSNVTGEGFDPFYEALVAMVEGIRPKPIDGVFRLPLDRAFTAKGHGTVVAGIPVAGAAHLGDELVLLPQGQAGRVRSIEVYGRSAEVVKAGQCAALNMRHWDHQAIGRGDVVAVPGYFRPQRWFACTLRLLSHGGEKPALKNGAKVRFHTGTSDRPAVLYTLQGDRVEPGGECLVQIGLSTPLVAGPGDRYILRTLSPVQTVGGGMVIEPHERRLKRKRPHVREELQECARAVPEPSRFVEYCLRRAPTLAAGADELAVRAKVPRARLDEIMAALADEQKALSPVPGLFMHAETAAEAGRRIVQTLEDFHARSPESPGMTREELREATGLDRALLGGLVAFERAAGRIVERGDRLAAAGHRPTFQDEEARLAEAIEGLFRDAPFHPPSAEEVATQTGADARTVGKLLRLLQEHQRLVPVGENLLCHREAVDRAREILVEFLRKEGKLESVKFKYLLDTTRKFALPLLDYFDRVGVTRRVGNTRYLKKT